MLKPTALQVVIEFPGICLVRSLAHRTLLWAMVALYRVSVKLGEVHSDPIILRSVFLEK